ncbi:4Fe-4S dicluster domain-containing protein [Candidatus Bathyarchaeota archaeon]|nr:4Fe-4S dicluster domain-containing protein [Candidatus Bathyarchaeota archaeon]
MKRIVVKVESCTGCKTCELVCSFGHSHKFSPSISRIRVIKDDEIGMDYPVMCHQCSGCSILSNCPTKAVSQKNNGVIFVDYSKCISCGNCVKACKYSAIKIYENKPIICDLCENIPKCVLKCPTKALIFENANEPDEPLIEYEKFMRRWNNLE